MVRAQHIKDELAAADVRVDAVVGENTGPGEDSNLRPRRLGPGRLRLFVPFDDIEQRRTVRLLERAADAAAEEEVRQRKLERALQEHDELVGSLKVVQHCVGLEQLHLLARDERCGAVKLEHRDAVAPVRPPRVARIVDRDVNEAARGRVHGRVRAERVATLERAVQAARPDRRERGGVQLVGQPAFPKRKQAPAGQHRVSVGRVLEARDAVVVQPARRARAEAPTEQHTAPRTLRAELGGLDKAAAYPRRAILTELDAHHVAIPVEQVGLDPTALEKCRPGAQERAAQARRHGAVDLGARERHAFLRQRAHPGAEVALCACHGVP